MTDKNSPLLQWTPPANFTQVESAVEGITVFAPRPKTDQEKAVTYRCPHCGAPTKYDVTAGGVACEYCGYTAPLQAQTPGRSAEEYEFTLDTLKKAQQGWGAERRELHCEACGANMSIPANALTVTCPFCTSNRVNVRVTPSDQLRPRFLVPFKVQPEKLRASVTEWLGKGWYHPKELGASSVLDRFSGVFLPFWTFDTQIAAAWKAEVGYERQERYYDSGAKEWRTRTRIDWRWESGQVELKIDDYLVNASANLSQLILSRILPFDMNELVAYQPDYLAGLQAKGYDLNLPDAWEQAKTQLREDAHKACLNDIPTSHVRNFSMVADFAGETWRYILLPVYLSTYRFKDEIYQVMVNGQTGAIAGQKPVNWTTVWLVIAAMLAPGALSILIGLPMLLMGGIGMLPLILGFILLIAGGIGAGVLYNKARQSEAK